MILFDVKGFLETFSRPINVNGIDTGYHITYNGIVYKDNKIVYQYTGTHGYRCVTLYYDNQSHLWLVHRLVAMAYCHGQTCERRYVNHIDGNKQNNDYRNLEWVTNRENMMHAVKTGMHQSNKHVYTDKQIHDVCRMLQENKLTHSEICEKTHVNPTLIRDIKFRNKHKSITKLYNINKFGFGHKDDRQKIFDLINKGYSNVEISKMLNVNKRHIEYCKSLYIKNKKA
jgi:hypothetical protein